MQGFNQILLVLSIIPVGLACYNIIMDKITIGVVAKWMVVDGRVENVVHESINGALCERGAIVKVIMPVAGRRQPMVDHPESALSSGFSEEERAQLAAQLDDCDGVLLQGGNYSDLYEGLVAGLGYERDLPILGICAGCQVMAQMRGATLAPVGDRTVHISTQDRAHDLLIEPDSQLARVLGTTSTWTNSRHGHCVVDPGQLQVSAKAPDGTIEALEAPEKRFYLAIQSHPEDICDDNQAMDKLFQAFLQAAREYRESQQAVEQSSTEDSASGSRQSPTEAA